MCVCVSELSVALSSEWSDEFSTLAWWVRTPLHTGHPLTPLCVKVLVLVLCHHKKKKDRKKRKYFAGVFYGHHESLDYFIDHTHSTNEFNVHMCLRCMVHSSGNDAILDDRFQEGASHQIWELRRGHQWNGLKIMATRKTWNQTQHLAFNRSVFFLNRNSSRLNSHETSFSTAICGIIIHGCVFYNGLSMLSAFCGQHKFGQGGCSIGAIRSITARGHWTFKISVSISALEAIHAKYHVPSKGGLRFPTQINFFPPSGTPNMSVGRLKPHQCSK